MKEIFFSKKGMTLIEMMMAISIFVIGMIGFTLLFSKTWQSNSYTLEIGQASFSASQGVNKMADYIRRTRQGDDGAYPIEIADDNNLIIFCDYDKDETVERLHFYKNNQDILMGVTEPTETIPKTYPSGDQKIVTIASSVVNDSGSPIFYYFNKDYPVDTINNPISTPALVEDVRLVKIYLEINVQSSQAPDNLKMQSFVEMRNLNDYNRI